VTHHSVCALEARVVPTVLLDGGIITHKSKGLSNKYRDLGCDLNRSGEGSGSKISEDTLQ
jgi:hypothetical protein